MSTCNCPSCYARRGWESKITAQSEARDAMLSIPPGDVRIAPPGQTLAGRLVDDVYEGVRLLPGVTPAQALDRARNIVQALIANYQIEDHEPRRHE